MPLIRQRILFQGHVQGVGFRMVTRRIAADFEVTGYVRNLMDGRVELVVEGQRSDVESFVNRVRETLADAIRHDDVHGLPATGEFQGFTIES